MCNDVGWQPDQIIQVNPVLTTAEDTRKAVSTMKALNIGILVFAEVTAQPEMYTNQSGRPCWS